jgi:hypothetical protein
MPLPNDILENLPEELRTNETLNNFNDVGALAKSYVEARSMLGNAIRIPSEDAGEEDRARFLEKLVNNAPELMVKPDLSEPEQSEAFYKTIGRPDDPAGYTKPENVKLDTEVENELRNVLHAAGLSDAQFQKVLGAFSEREAQRQELVKASMEEATGDLKGKWGVTFEDRVNAAQKINEEFYPGRDFASVSPAEIESLYRVHESMTGKAAPAAQQESAPSGMTPQEAKERAEEIMRKVHDRSSNLSHDERMTLINKRMRILQEAGVVGGSLDDLRR